jgi:hypothetical protein
LAPLLNEIPFGCAIQCAPTHLAAFGHVWSE